MCLCCGYPDLDCRPYENVPDDPHPISLDPPYGDHWGIPSYEVCPCCGFEFGNDDNPGLYAKPINFLSISSIGLKTAMQSGLILNYNHRGGT